MQLSQDSTPNRLVRALSEESFAALRPSLERVDLQREQIVSEPDKPIRQLYFPEGGVISLVCATAETLPTEVGLIGWEGMTGSAVALGATTSPFTAMVQVDGTTSLRIDADEFLARCDEIPELHRLVLRYAHTIQVQTAFSLLSHAHHLMEARLARWLLMCCDRIEGDKLYLPHEFLAIMLGSQRSSVTVTVHVLEGLGAIRSTRGIVTIADRAKLEELAGDTYGPAEAEYDRLIDAPKERARAR